MNPRPAKVATPFDVQRQGLVEVLRSRGITDEGVLQAINTVPREVFVPPAMSGRAYEDSALPIDNRQTISQPYTVAFMTQSLKVTRGMRVLEIGTGSGYQAAVLAQMGASVVTIERHPLLSQKARTALADFGYTVQCRIGDGTIGFREGGPYEGIIVTAGAPDVPEPLAKQLSIGGRLVVPVGSLENQTLYRVVRTAEDSWKAEDLGPFKFVPLIGRSGWDDASAA
ncbi:MAG TPA: protein-L-isoaspartate(D-aspartate) O-methyltransferase [Candidatus Didemnitutus sp.]|nr:protein-L-isoaspartate(D-aspartate) O-methyltransferase [Candidatus Didemnitutus sp.]